jgi:hypothetical protein
MNQQMINHVIGLPVFIEHDDRFQIGVILNAYIDILYNLCVILEIKQSMNSYIFSGIDQYVKRTGRFPYMGLSLGTNVKISTSDKKIKVEEISPIEVSIVSNPDREGADILHFKRTFTTDGIYTKLHTKTLSGKSNAEINSILFQQDFSL